jgi:hypothetical protein
MNRTLLKFLISQAVTERGRRRRARQLGLHRNQHGRTARQAPAIRAGNFFHGVDQHRQPSSLAAFRSPRLKLLAHHLSLSSCRYQPGSRRPVPTTCPEENRAERDPLHKSSGRPVLTFQNGRKNPAHPVRTADRPPHRLRPDRHRHRCRPDGADLSHPDLMQRRDGGSTPSLVLWGSAATRRKVQLAPAFSRVLPAGAPALVKTRQAECAARSGFAHRHCVNRA